MAANDKPVKTAKQLENLKPGDRKYRRSVTNGEKGGLSVMVLPSGTRQFIYRYRRPRDSKQTELTLPTQELAKAREIHTQCREWLMAGKDPAIELHKEKRGNAEALTMQAIFDEWIEHYGQTPSRKTKRLPTEKTVSKHKKRWNIYLKSGLGSLSAREVERWQMARVLDKAKKRSAEEARQCLTILREMLGYAETHGFVNENHAMAISASRLGLVASRPRERALSLEDLREVWKALDAGKADAITASVLKMLIITGARRSEITAMRWDEVDTETGVFTIPGERTKNRKPHCIYLPPIALSLLRELRPLTEDSGFVFESTRKPGSPVHPDSVTTALERLRGVTRPGKGKIVIDEKAPLSGLVAFSVHDIRRSARTAWGQHCKILPHVAEAMLNHLPAKLIQTYDRGDYWEEKKAGWTIWGELIESVIARDPGNVVTLVADIQQAEKAGGQD